ncbi:MAG: aminoglycoside phosphotransferase family protein [Thermoprotei archaeon]
MCKSVEGADFGFSAWLSSLGGFSSKGCVRLNARRPIYEVRDATGRSIIVKLYGEDPVDEGEKERRLMKEYKALESLWNEGLGDGAYRVVKPLGYYLGNYYALAEEKATGINLLEQLRRKIKARGSLVNEINGVAELLARIHMTKPTPKTWWVPDWRRKVLGVRAGSLENELMEAGKIWEAEFPLPLPVVPLHGDPNPTNFCYDEFHLTAFDLQMYHYGYPVEDLGEFAAELKFAFEQYAGNPSEAEPYIGIMFKTYSVRTGLSFETLTAYNPFFMGIWELSMASNSFMAQKRSWLIREAYRCWKFGLQYIKRRSMPYLLSASSSGYHFH